MDVILVLIWTICCSAGLTTGYDASAILANNARYPCGIQHPAQIIPNDHAAEHGLLWPWHAALFHGKDLKCGGTLIDQRHVLTSAHCVLKEGRKVLDPGTITVHLGKIDHARIMKVREIHVHEESHRNDIALLVLANDVRFSDHVVPICMDVIETDHSIATAGKNGWIAGWGATEDGRLSKHLKTAQVRIVNGSICNQSSNPKIFCASKEKEHSFCCEDSGCGMYVLAGGRWELRGISSYVGPKPATGRCKTIEFTSFTNVAAYRNWILQKTKWMIDKKRISERKCLQYQQYARRKNGICLNVGSPHTVEIIDNNHHHISSGVIISESFVLTKASNFYEFEDEDINYNDALRVRIGKRILRVRREIPHPAYDQRTYRNHILLLELETPLVLTESLLPACLASREAGNSNHTLILNGYTGKDKAANDFYENDLSKTVSSGECNKSINETKYRVNEEESCTRFTSEPQALTGKGITGGPLQTFNDRSCTYTLIGISKFIIPHGENHFINVYSRVTAYLDWIEEVTWASSSPIIVPNVLMVVVALAFSGYYYK